MLGILWRALELLLADINLVTFQIGIVGEQRPGQWIIIFTDSHETAEAHYRVSDLSAELIDHHPLDLTDAVAVRAIDRRALDLVAADETDGFALLQRLALARHGVLLFNSGTTASPHAGFRSASSLRPQTCPKCVLSGAQWLTFTVTFASQQLPLRCCALPPARRARRTRARSIRTRCRRSPTRTIRQRRPRSCSAARPRRRICKRAPSAFIPKAASPARWRCRSTARPGK